MYVYMWVCVSMCMFVCVCVWLCVVVHVIAESSDTYNTVLSFPKIMFSTVPMRYLSHRIVIQELFEGFFDLSDRAVGPHLSFYQSIYFHMSQYLYQYIHFYLLLLHIDTP